MKRASLAAAAAAAAVLVSANAFAVSVYDPTTNSTYVLNPTALTWTNANTAVPAGGHLARIDNAGQNAAVRAAAAPAAGGNAWIGANDQATEGTWVWSNNNDPFWQGVANGTPVGGRYNAWNAGEPNDVGGEDFAQITGAGVWNDLPATSTLPSVQQLPGNLAGETFNGHRYIPISAGTWSATQAQAEALGGNLVRIDDAAENAYVADLVTRLGQNVWIGANDAATEGQWVWSDNDQQFWQGAGNGAPVNGLYTNWNPGEPNDVNGEDFAEIGADGRWNDLPASFTRLGLVEVVPEPTALALLGLAGAGLLARRRRA